MSFRLALPITALLTAVALAWPDAPRVVHATEGDPMADGDGDFLPDSVEWIALTSASNANTDGDTVGDFIEYVQRGRPRQASPQLALDHELRIAVTGPQPGAASDAAHLHIFVLRAESAATLSGLTAWLEVPFLPGVRVAFDPFVLPGASMDQRSAGADGEWLRFSVPLLGAPMLQSLAPCSVHVEAVVGGRTLHSAVKLINAQNTLATLTPFDGDDFAVQSLAPLPASSGALTSNRVCVLEMQEVGSGPGGTMYAVVGASCEDCNELECVLSVCTQSIGWIVTLPGGVGPIGGN